MRSLQAGIATRPIGIGSQVLAIVAAAALLAFTFGVGLASPRPSMSCRRA